MFQVTHLHKPVSIASSNGFAIAILSTKHAVIKATQHYLRGFLILEGQMTLSGWSKRKAYLALISASVTVGGDLRPFRVREETITATRAIFHGFLFLFCFRIL